MPRWIIIVMAIAIIVIIVTGGYIVLNYVDNKKQPSSNGTEEIRDTAIEYIATNHVETVNFTSNLAWSGGRQDTGLVGSDSYLYTTTYWTVTLTCPVVPNPIYQIDANYTKDNVTVDWQGTYQNGTIGEISYITYNIETIISPQQQARTDVMSFIVDNHNETLQYLTADDSCVGGRATPAGLVGSETYKYTFGGWNITMQYPVVPNPIYQVNITYTNPNAQVASQPIIVDWQGTWQNGTVTETNYTYNP